MVTSDGDISVLKDDNCFKTVTKRYDCTSRNLYKARVDSQVITEDEVLDIKAGSIVMACPFYSRKEEKQICKVVIVNDPTAAYDIDALDKLKLEHSKENK